MTHGDHYQAELAEAAARWSEEGLPEPDVVLVAGSGLSGDFAEPVAGPRDLMEMLPFPAAGIAGHALSWEVLRTEAGDRRPCHVLYLRGRLHAYQGFGAPQVVFPIRLAALLGARVAIITNAAGGLYEGVRAGDLALIRDQINLTGLNPLRGTLPPEWGPQFPDMSQAYDPALRKLARRCAEELGLGLREAVYVGVAGPSYETPAEIRAFATLGAGLVGMSTVLEVIAARHMGLRCLGLSLVTNPAAGLGEESLRHDDVLEIGRRAAERVRGLLGEVLRSPDLLD